MEAKGQHNVKVLKIKKITQVYCLTLDAASVTSSKHFTCLYRWFPLEIMGLYLKWVFLYSRNVQTFWFEGHTETPNPFSGLTTWDGSASFYKVHASLSLPLPSPFFILYLASPPLPSFCACPPPLIWLALAPISLYPVLLTHKQLGYAIHHTAHIIFPDGPHEKLW